MPILMGGIGESIGSRYTLSKGGEENFTTWFSAPTGSPLAGAPQKNPMQAIEIMKINRIRTNRIVMQTNRDTLLQHQIRSQNIAFEIVMCIVFIGQVRH